MKKIIFLIFGVFSITLFGWVGSNAKVELRLPYDYDKKGKVIYYVPAGIYGIVYNPEQGIDKHEIILKDNTTGETSILTTVQDRNIDRATNLSTPYILKSSLFKFDGRDYTIELKVYDLNGDTWSDTAIVIPVNRGKNE